MGFSYKGEKLKGLMKGSESVTATTEANGKRVKNTKLKKGANSGSIFFFLTIYIGELKKG